MIATGPQRPRHPQRGTIEAPSTAADEDAIAAVNRVAHQLQMQLRDAHRMYRKAMRRPKGSNGRRKQLAIVRQQLESVDEEAYLMHMHDVIMPPVFVELLAALRNGKL